MPSWLEDLKRNLQWIASDGAIVVYWIILWSSQYILGNHTSSARISLKQGDSLTKVPVGWGRVTALQFTLVDLYPNINIQTSSFNLWTMRLPQDWLNHQIKPVHVYPVPSQKKHLPSPMWNCRTWKHTRHHTCAKMCKAMALGSHWTHQVERLPPPQP